VELLSNWGTAFRPNTELSECETASDSMVSFGRKELFATYRMSNMFWHGKLIIPAIYATLINYLVQECHWN